MIRKYLFIYMKIKVDLFAVVLFHAIKRIEIFDFSSKNQV
jgi:hypothetical protein